MRIAVVSDIHGNLEALKAVLEDINGREVDVTVNLGDVVSGLSLANWYGVKISAPCHIVTPKQNNNSPTTPWYDER